MKDGFEDAEILYEELTVLVSMALPELHEVGLAEVTDEEVIELLELGLIEAVYDVDGDPIEVVVTDCDFTADRVEVNVDVSEGLPVEVGDTIEVIVDDQDGHGDFVVVTVADV